VGEAKSFRAARRRKTAFRGRGKEVLLDGGECSRGGREGGGKKHIWCAAAAFCWKVMLSGFLGGRGGGGELLNLRLQESLVRGEPFGEKRASAGGAEEKNEKFTRPY